MKNQQEIYQALMDGKTVQHKVYGKIYMVDGVQYDAKNNNTAAFGFEKPNQWHIYTEPTEYEVALYDVWTGSAWYRTTDYYKEDEDVALDCSYNKNIVVKRTNITQIIKTNNQS